MDGMKKRGDVVSPRVDCFAGKGLRLAMTWRVMTCASKVSRERAWNELC